MNRREITFDRAVRGLLYILIAAALIWLLNRLSKVLLPFVISWLIAYMLFPLVKFLQYKCKIKFRMPAVLLSMVAVVAVVVGFVWIVVPPMINESVKIKDFIVAYAENNTFLNNIPQKLQEYIHTYLDDEHLSVLASPNGIAESLKQAMPHITNVLSQSMGVLTGLVSSLIVILYTFFILLDYERLSEGWIALIPKRIRPFITQLVNDIGDGMNKYFRGQALVALCVGILFCIGFLIIDFPMAIGLGLFIGLLNMVPYLQTLGFIPTILLALVKAAETQQNFWLIMLAALAVFAIVQVIQDSFIVPKIMGKVTGLNSAIILLSLSIWGSLLGLMGMIIALPLTSLLLNYYQKYIVGREEQQEASEVATITTENNSSPSPQQKQNNETETPSAG